jgi:hypothetical protein
MQLCARYYRLWNLWHECPENCRNRHCDLGVWAGIVIVNIVVLLGLAIANWCHIVRTHKRRTTWTEAIGFAVGPPSICTTRSDDNASSIDTPFA